MRTEHLSDEEIQQYVMDTVAGQADTVAGQPDIAAGQPDIATGQPDISAHVQSCDECQSRVAAYRSLFASIRQQPRPSFDVNLAALVIAQLPSNKPRFTRSDFFAYMLIIDGAGLIGIGCYLFRKDLAKLFAGFTYAFGYLIATAVATILIFQCMDLYAKYEKKMRALDL
jgi:hypothetical protein